MGSDAERLLGEAAAHHEAGRLAEAEAAYRRLLEHGPDHPSVLHLLGVVHYQTGRLDEATALIERAVALDPQEADYRSNLGNVFKAKGRVEDAVTEYRAALRLDPGSLDARNNLGNALKTLGRLDEAEREYRSVLATDPERPEVHNNLGALLRESGRLDEAVAAYETAVKLNPDYADALHNLGNALLGRERYEEATPCFRRLLDLRPDDPAALNDLGTSYRERRLFDDAESVFRRALAIRPEFADARYNLGVVLEDRGAWEEAAASYRETLERSPGHALASKNLGILLTRQGKPLEASRVFREWLKLDPENPVAIHMVSSCGGEPPPERASNAYLKDVFDEFARGFDTVLSRLDYRGPELVSQAIAIERAAAADADVLDAGCGTGLCAPLLRPYARRLVGVDLSPEMLRKARERDLYDDLIEAELVAHLDGRDAAYDLIAAADTLVYFGNLQPLLAAASRALRPGGLFVFTVEAAGDSASDAGFVLCTTGRYAHTESYLRSAIAAAGLDLRAIDEAATRLGSGGQVPGYLVRVRRV